MKQFYQLITYAHTLAFPLETNLQSLDKIVQIFQSARSPRHNDKLSDIQRCSIHQRANHEQDREVVRMNVAHIECPVHTY